MVPLALPLGAEELAHLTEQVQKPTVAQEAGPHFQVCDVTQLVVTSPLWERVLWLVHDPSWGTRQPSEQGPGLHGVSTGWALKPKSRGTDLPLPNVNLCNPKALTGALLCSLPIVTIPFERISIDRGAIDPIVVLPQVVVGYTTWYSKAIALRNIQAETVAKELAILCSRVGFPQQVVSDQGTNFMSKTLQAMWRFLGSTTSDVCVPPTGKRIGGKV